MPQPTHADILRLVKTAEQTPLFMARITAYQSAMLILEAHEEVIHGLRYDLVRNADCLDSALYDMG